MSSTSSSQAKNDATPKAPVPEEPKAEVSAASAATQDKEDEKPAAVEKRSATEDDGKPSPTKRQRTCKTEANMKIQASAIKKEASAKEEASVDKKEEASAKKEEPEEVIDLCAEMGLKAGDRLEVEWLMPNEQGVEKAVWWKCCLLPHDGRSEEGVAVRTLEYEPYGVYDEKTQDDVIFLSHEIVIRPDDQAELSFRPEGMVQFSGEAETREAINSILMETLEKHSAKWESMDRAQQGEVAAIIAKKKEMLVQAIMSHSKGPIIGGEEMKEILNGVMKKK